MIPGLGRLRDRYEAALLDLDGTVLDGRSELTPRTNKAIRALVDAGIKVVLCTGRGMAGTIPTHTALELDTAMVTYNGSWIGSADRAPERYIPIPDEHLAPLFDHEQEAAFSFRHQRGGKHTVMSEHPDHDEVANWFEQVVRAEALGHLPTSDLLRLSMFFCESTLPAGEVEHALHARLPGELGKHLRIECFPLNLFPPYAKSTLHLYEVQGASRGKAEAFEWLEARHGIPAERTIAIGDHRNDLTMLAGAGLAVTPANGVPACQAHAHLTIGHHAEEGLAAWIEAGAPLDGRRPRADDREPVA